MGRRGRLALAVTAAALAAPTAASAAPAPTEVGANGNAFAGGLSFTPPDVTVPVGGVVRWTNTDYLVPHTATEDHRLFDLAGDYGATPANPPGFGPGDSVEWRFAAGTFDYFCEVHPEDMVGTVATPPSVGLRGSKRRLRAAVTWAKEELPEGQVFDVQRSKAGGPWKKVEDGTEKLKGRYRARRGQTLGFRARVRWADDPAAASGWSPETAIAIN